MKVGLIYGGGLGVFTEAQEARDLIALTDAEIVTIAVNDAGADPRAPDPLDHWVSIHPEKLATEPWMWAERRAEAGLSGGYVVWSVSRLHSVVDRRMRDVADRRRWTGGSSGLLAVGVAMRLGLDRVILCGVPLDERANEFKGAWGEHVRFRPSWLRDAEYFGHVVRSMSGWTSQILRVPTLDWLTEEQEPIAANEFRRRDEAYKLRGAA